MTLAMRSALRSPDAREYVALSVYADRLCKPAKRISRAMQDHLSRGNQMLKTVSGVWRRSHRRKSKSATGMRYVVAWTNSLYGMLEDDGDYERFSSLRKARTRYEELRADPNTYTVDLCGIIDTTD